jgi:L-arabinokinase
MTVGAPLVFYISGHGFGHASRDIEVINTLGRRRPGVRILVRTTVPPWFFEQSAQVPMELQQAEVDTGVVQIDSLRLDEDATARQAARFYADFEGRVVREAAILRALGASLVVGDVPPLAFAAAHLAGVPSLALANFTWDWIYAAYPQFEHLAPGILALIRGAYGSATCALRLPLGDGFEPMAAVTRNVPLVARRSRLGRAVARRAMELDGELPIVLASFGGYGSGLSYDEVIREARFTLVATDHEMPLASTAAGRLRCFTRQALADRGLRYTDLVAAADVVVSKPGYGIVSECIANGPALLYTSRGRFAEYDLLAAEMPRVLRCRYLPPEDLRAGRWADAVSALLGQSPPRSAMAINGAGVVADHILAMAGSRQDS